MAGNARPHPRGRDLVAPEGIGFKNARTTGPGVFFVSSIIIAVSTIFNPGYAVTGLEFAFAHVLLNASVKN